MSRQTLTSLIAVAVLAHSAQADFITGFVVDSQGVGVPGVDIDVKNLGSGGTPTIFNDGTDATGFFMTTVPDGLYDVTFTPPPPPATSDLITVVESVVVVGTTNMGNVTLTPGVELSGRVLNPAAVPVSGINLDVIDQNGDNLDLTGDFTDAFGMFRIAAPFGDVELRMNTNPVFGQTLASTALQMNLAADTNLGDVSLEAGFVVTAMVRTSGGAPVPDVDLDVTDTVTMTKLYTPGDNTDGSGFVDVIVPAGVFDFDFCPTQGEQLVGSLLEALPIAATTDLGIVTLVNGFVLSGNVTAGGSPVAGVDVNVDDSVTGVGVHLCGDNTNGAGNYSVLVPAGVFDVIFTAPPALGLQPDVHSGVVVAGNTALNGSLQMGGGGGFVSSCNGDGGNQMGCTDCPCSNNAAPGTIGGCINSAGTSLRLIAMNSSSIAAGDLRFEASGAPPANSAVLVSGGGLAPQNAASPCFGLDSGVQSFALDGLRCAVQGVLRHGVRPSDASGNIGVTTNGWGTPNGFFNFAAFAPGATRHFQLFSREVATQGCLTGQTTSQAVTVSFTP